MVINRLLGAIAITTVFGAVNADLGAAQTTAPGPYYASPSWDQTLPPNTRFIILSNMNSEAFLDRETGLVWARANTVDSGTQQLIELTQRHARNLCASLALGARKGWRLPLLDELLTLATPGGPSAAPLTITLGPSGFSEFWTNELNDTVTNIDLYWKVALDNANVRSGASQGSSLALCVRGR